ncbi:MAG: ribonuclease H [Candidatus Magasanikbacteria bacterium CG10_big_fil_rev_8_21_14_0_10_36_32]|uniref:Ribonuclease H n=1 Tax=Candidatus Magasanikbacteria bacterium CG10_big_fil_rev_8_21_14_0_10_36_32 TaxID=1974646 RepID=A0A2M6W642_9BACT|nr:MAG: ribonuclease H [Candidatus Magasanikbacteria bacterium CG10_big_fil_rev_8_21_14_0_10_36_32]
MRLTINTDGGARGNPGPAAIGVIIKDEKQKIICGYGEYLGEQTNNYAEYAALISGLKKAKEFNADEVECILDSELVVKQMRQEYKVKEPTLQKLFIQAYNAATQFKKVTYRHTERANNTEADKLVNETLDKQK